MAELRPLPPNLEALLLVNCFGQHIEILLAGQLKGCRRIVLAEKDRQDDLGDELSRLLIRTC